MSKIYSSLLIILFFIFKCSSDEPRLSVKRSSEPINISFYHRFNYQCKDQKAYNLIKVERYKILNRSFTETFLTDATNYNIISRDDLDIVLSERSFSHTGLTTAPIRNKLKNVDVLYVSNDECFCNKIEYLICESIDRFIDIKTGKILNEFNIQSEYMLDNNYGIIDINTSPLR